MARAVKAEGTDVNVSGDGMDCHRAVGAHFRHLAGIYE